MYTNGVVPPFNLDREKTSKDANNRLVKEASLLASLSNRFS